ncbi:MAG: PilZ domain-containing protein [Chthonomonadales bacterium]
MQDAAHQRRIVIIIPKAWNNGQVADYELLYTPEEVEELARTPGCKVHALRSMLEPRGKMLRLKGNAWALQGANLRAERARVLAKLKRMAMDEWELLRNVRTHFLGVGARNCCAAGPDNRRQFYRWDAGGLPATLHTLTQEHPVRLIDISPAGAKIGGAPPLSSGEQVVLAAIRPEARLILACEVVRCDASSGTAGLHFIGVTPSDTVELFRFIQSLPNAAHPQNHAAALTGGAA